MELSLGELIIIPMSIPIRSEPIRLMERVAHGEGLPRRRVAPHPIR
jgi:hypothetical protein